MIDQLGHLDSTEVPYESISENLELILHDRALAGAKYSVELYCDASDAVRAVHGMRAYFRDDPDDKVSRRLVGVAIPADALTVAAETPLYRGDKQAGVITSVAGLKGVETVALGYVKTRIADIGDTVQLGSANGCSVLLHDFPIPS